MSERNERAGDTLPRESGEFGLASHLLGGVPIVNHVLDRLGLPALLSEALGEVDGRTKLAPAAAIRLVLTARLLEDDGAIGRAEDRLRL